MIHLYYGNGKGKTSAAIGAGMRAAGAGMKVFLAQFLKNNQSSELKAVPFTVFEAPETLSFHPDSAYQPWVDAALDAALQSDADMLILDELLDVIPAFVPPEALEPLFCLREKEIIITGHKEIKALTEKADYVTRFEGVKHPYDKGVQARKGIEY